MTTYNVTEVAILLNVTDETVRRWIRNGKLNATRKLGRGGHRITNDDIQNMLKAPEFKKLNTDFIRNVFASENPIVISSTDTESDNDAPEIIDEEVPESIEERIDTIEISKEELKGKITKLIEMRDCLNEQINELICLL